MVLRVCCCCLFVVVVIFTRTVQSSTNFIPKSKNSTKLNSLELLNLYVTHNNLTYSKSPALGSGFKWSNCGSSADPASLLSLQVHPDPIRIPGLVSVSFKGSLVYNVTAPLTVSLKVEYRVPIIDYWKSIPCIENVGSCSYSNICDLLPSGDCPAFLSKQHLPCHCPVPQGKYKANKLSVEIPKKYHYIPHGDYYVKALISHSGKRLACYEIYATIRS